MFLKNERGLGVKNGTLGKSSACRPTAWRCAGRWPQVAFDLKDYAHVDHGYAATIHKSQGVTVDRAHVLATPAWTAIRPMWRCRGTATGCSSIMAATTSPIGRLSAR
jgi:ATP-dependent exoDNAse (exonuclease V) alpha subunit